MIKEFTAYLKVPSKYCNGLRLEFDPDPEPIILDSGITDPDKVYEIVTLEKSFGIWSVGDRFTGKEIELSGKGTVFEITTNFVFARKDIPGKVVGKISANLYIVHVHFKRHFIKAILRLSNSINLDDNAIASAKLMNAYIGKTDTKVIEQYPDQGDIINIGTPEEPIMQRRLEIHEWNGING